MFLGIFSGTALADTAEESFKKGSAAMRNNDYETAEREYRKAAEQGHLSAQIQLALMYLWYDDKESMKWWKKAADQGSSGAQLALADLFREGGRERQLRDYGEAMKWYRKAAESANMDHQADAQLGFGEIYEDGLGVPQDLLLAHMWYNLSYMSSMRKESQEAREAASARDKVARRLSPEQLIRSQKMAEKWKTDRGK